jgi:hypothetical protein
MVMACITQKKGRRYRIQFTMKRELFEIYQESLDLAEKLSVDINFGHDFEEWFGNQLAEIKCELENLQKHRSSPGHRQVTEALSARTVTSATGEYQPNSFHGGLV